MERWKKNLWILWVTQVISLMSFGFGLPFIPVYIKELGQFTESQLNLYTTILAAAPALTMGIMAPIWGNLADRFGRKLMILRAMFFAVFIISGMGIVQNVHQLIVLRLLQGLFTGTVGAAMTFVASNTPKKEMTYALGVITSSTFIGYSIGPMIGGVVADLFGNRMSFFVGGGLMIVGAMLVLILVKEDKSTLMQKSNKKIGFKEKYQSIFIPSIMIILLMLFCLRISRSMFAPYVARFLDGFIEDDGKLSLISGLITGLVGFSTAFASMIMGRVAQRVNKMKLMTVLLGIGVILMTLILKYETIATYLGIEQSLIVFFGIYMGFYFIIGGVEPIITSTSALQVESSDRGALFGLQGMMGSLAWFAAPAIAGPIVIYQPVETVLNFVPIFLGINLILSLLLRRALTKKDMV